MFKLSAAAAVALLVASGAKAAPPHTVGPVFVIALENHNFVQPKGYTAQKQLLHNPAAPFLLRYPLIFHTKENV